MLKKHDLKLVCIPVSVWSGNKEIISCIESYYISMHEVRYRAIKLPP